MRSPRSVRKEHKKVCQAMKDMVKKGGRCNRTPLPKDEYMYGRLAIVKMTLEWVHPLLIKTKAKGPDRLNELMGYRHFANGPTHAVLYP
jgi:hypothetical protein